MIKLGYCARTHCEYYHTSTKIVYVIQPNTFEVRSFCHDHADDIIERFGWVLLTEEMAVCVGVLES